MRYTKIRIGPRTYLVVSYFVGREDSISVISRPLSLLRATALVKIKNAGEGTIKFHYAPKWR